MVTKEQAHQRLAAFEEFMKEYRKERWLFYADPSIPQDVKGLMDESARQVFYAGYAAGLGSNLLSGLAGKKTPD